jgi:hypothetical protein
MEDKERRGCQCIYVQKSFSPGIESFVVQASIERNDPQLQALFDLGPTRSEAQRQSAHAFSMQCDLQHYTCLISSAAVIYKYSFSHDHVYTHPAHYHRRQKQQIVTSSS